MKIYIFLLCNAGLDRDDSAIERKSYSRQLKLQKRSRFGGAGRNFFPIVANFENWRPIPRQLTRGSQIVWK